MFIFKVYFLLRKCTIQIHKLMKYVYICAKMCGNLKYVIKQSEETHFNWCLCKEFISAYECVKLENTCVILSRYCIHV